MPTMDRWEEALPDRKKEGDVVTESIQAPPSSAKTELGRRTVRKVARRLVPFIGLLYFVNYLDRTNIGFAKLTMSEDLGAQRDDVRGRGRRVLHRVPVARCPATWRCAAGWRVMFLLEGIPAVVLAFVTWFYLTDRPAKATWTGSNKTGLWVAGGAMLGAAVLALVLRATPPPDADGLAAAAGVDNGGDNGADSGGAGDPQPG